MMDPQQVADWAVRLLIANPFPGKSQRELVEIINACRLQRFSDGQFILKEGESGEELYFLMEGEVEVLKRDVTGEERSLVVMKAPTMFGHMSLVDGSARSASCRAKGQVDVAVLSRQTYLELLSRSHPLGTSLRRLMLATLTRQLVDGNAWLFGLIGGKLPAKESSSPSPSPSPVRSSSPPPRAAGTQVPKHVLERSPEKAPSSRPSTADRPARRQKTRDDVSRSDLLDMAGILNGWKVDARGLEDIEFVETEDDRRRSGKNST